MLHRSASQCATLVTFTAALATHQASAWHVVPCLGEQVSGTPDDGSGVTHARRPSSTDADAVTFSVSELRGVGLGAHLPAAFDSLGARGLRVVRRSELQPGALHLCLEHPGDASRHASLVLHDGRLTGAIYPGGSLRVVLTGDSAGFSRRSHENAADDLPCGHHDALRVGDGADDLEPDGDGGVAGACDDGSRVDVFVLYTQAAVNQAGGLTQLQDWLLWAVADSNAIYADSGIGLSMRLVGSALAQGYSENASMSNDLYALTDPADGILDEALPLRNSARADMVALVRADGGGACGVAWLTGSSAANEEYGYSVTALGCFTNRTFTHELGHNMGCCHAPGDGGGCLSGGVFPYSTGHRFFGTNGAEYRTVMAYAPGTRIPRFSSPLVSYQGTPTGIADARDNARTINTTRFAFTQYRCNPCEADVNGDGLRDGADLALVLTGWSSSAPDINADGVVNGADLAVLLDVWGPCP
jgi:hypothetical protein